jgi:hypothetical protein
MGDTLRAGESLTSGQHLVSKNGDYILLMQSDGDLALYQGKPDGDSALWTTETKSLRDYIRPTRAEMRSDGQLVLSHNSGIPTWAAGVSGNYPKSRLVLQDDGNLVILDQHSNQLWARNPSVAIKGLAREVVASEYTEVGDHKYMDTKATLYRNGVLIVDSYQKSDNWGAGLRGQILVLCIDGNANAHWISPVFVCPTRCSATDPTCASRGRVNFQANFPEPVGQYTERLDIYQADNPNYVDYRTRWIEVIKNTGEIVAAVAAVLALLA